MSCISNIKYRVNYIKLFIRYSKILELHISSSIIKLILLGSNPKTYKVGEYYYNYIISRNLVKYDDYKLRRINSVVFSNEEVKVLAINFKILTKLSNLSIMKYYDFMSYESKRLMNEYLYSMKGM